LLIITDCVDELILAVFYLKSDTSIVATNRTLSVLYPSPERSRRAV